MLGDEGFESFAEEQAELFWEGLTGEALEFGGPGAEWAFEDQPAAIAIPQGFRLGTWLDVGGRSLTTHGDRHAALLRELGFTDACVMFNGNDDARFGFGSVSESTLRAFAARLAGGAVRLTLCTWLRPEREFIDDLVRTLPSVARDLGARAIEFDVEEPWTRRHARGFANHAAAAEYLYAALRPATSGIELAVTCQVDVMPTATMRAIVSGADLVVPQAYSSPGAGRSHAIGGVYGPRGLQNRALNKVTEATGGAPKPVVMGLAAWKRERWAPNTPEQILRMELEHTLALPRTAAVQGARYWSWKHIAGLNGNGGAPAQSYGLPFFRGSLSVSPPALPAASNPAPSPGTAPSPSGQRSVAQPASPAAPAPVATPNQAQGAEGLRLDFFEDQERVEARGAEVSSDPEVSLEQSDSDEQAAVALPANIVVKWAGVDRSSIPQRASVPDTDWMGILLDNSNLRFTGAYVTGPALAGSPARSFTNSSQATARGWMPSMRTLVDQGWGAVFFYVGYSVGGNEPAPTSGLDRARGTLHGRHLRTILNALGPSFAGATVFIDNEDTVQTALTAALMDYYSALFDEMVRPDANLACFRPALYGHGKAIEQMLARRRDLFVWDVWLATRTTSVATT
ncbi:MAG TPA: hypothetical protein VGK73_23870, partial [Polyangiaceae bacterium]